MAVIASIGRIDMGGIFADRDLIIVASIAASQHGVMIDSSHRGECVNVMTFITIIIAGDMIGRFALGALAIMTSAASTQDKSMIHLGSR